MFRDNEGFPRLPYRRTQPHPDEVNREINRARAAGADPYDLVRRVIGIFMQYATLASRNDDFAARQWGTTDVAEGASEHWQYLRNADFTRGVTATQAYKWVASSTLGVTAVSTALPYGVPAGLQIINTGSPNEHYLQQSVSATGSTWYAVDGWIKVTSGTNAGYRVLENSGSSTARTHAVMFVANASNAPWRRLGDHNNIAGLAFKTHKGTTKLTFRLVVNTNSRAVFAQAGLEKGRRRHPWRPHILDRGNIVTSLKTAGSASWTGNITFSGAGLVRFRQKATKTFIASSTASISSATPLKVSSAGTVGTATGLSREDHVHRGVTSVYKTGNASADGRVGVVGSGGATVTIASGSLRIHAAAGVSLASTTPAAVSTAGTVGVGTTAARSDHVHRGVKAIKYGTASNDGTISFSGSGTGGALAWSGTKLKLGWPKPSTATPAKVSSDGTVGTNTTWSRGDHVHRGVTSIYKTANASADGRVGVVGSGGATVTISSGSLRIHAAAGVSLASTTPAAVSTAGTVGVGATAARSDHVHRGVKSIKYGTASNDGTVSLSGSGTGGALAWTGAKLKIGWPKPNTGTPAKVSSEGTVGTATTWSRGDHVHRGVTSVYKTGNASADGRVAVVGSGGATVTIASGALRIHTGAGTSTSIKTAGSASFSGNIVFSASGGGAVRQKATRTVLFGLDINGRAHTNPAVTDTFPMYDDSANANRKMEVRRLGGFTAINVSEFRLTLTTGTAVTTADVTAAGTIYLTPYIGNRIRIYDGTRWKLYQNAEISLALTATSGKNYDVFVYDNAGTLTLELSAAWTNDTTRADALTTQDGVYVKSGATTRLWVGTIRASAANATEDSQAKRFVANVYNEVARPMSFEQATASYNYTTATIRQWNASTTHQVEFVSLGRHAIHLGIGCSSRNTGNGARTIGIGLDSTTAVATDCNEGAYADDTNVGAMHASYVGVPSEGYHYLAALEWSQATGTTNWYGASAADSSKAGGSGWMMG